MLSYSKKGFTIFWMTRDKSSTQQKPLPKSKIFSIVQKQWKYCYIQGRTQGKMTGKRNNCIIQQSSYGKKRKKEERKKEERPKKWYEKETALSYNKDLTEKKKKEKKKRNTNQAVCYYFYCSLGCLTANSTSEWRSGGDKWGVGMGGEAESPIFFSWCLITASHECINNNNVHLSCTHQHPACSHDTH